MITLESGIYYTKNLLDVFSLDTECIQDVYNLDTQVRLGSVRLESTHTEIPLENNESNLCKTQQLIKYKKARKNGLLMELLMRLERTTCSLRVSCSTN